MPSKLETYKKEQERLSKKKRLTPADEKRLQQLSGLIKTETDRAPRDAGRAVVSSARRTLSGPWTGSSGTAMARRVLDGQATPYGMSAAKKARRDVVREQMGLAPLVEAGFREPIYDENTGALVGFKTPDSMEGFRFGPGPVTGQRSGSNIKGRDLTMMTGMSVKDVMEFYASLKPEELVKIQQDLMDAGLFGQSKPILGFRDDATMSALTNLMSIWAGNPDSGLPDLMATLKKEANSLLAGAAKERAGIGTVSDTVANVSVTDATTLDALIDQVSQELFGSNIDKGRKQELIARLQEQEKSYKTSAVTADYEASQAGKKAESGGADIDRFISALIGQESGGNPNAENADSGAMGLGQIMPENWGPWAAEAGVDPSDFSAANQMRVIRYKVSKYYEQYDNWQDVAVAWYGGAGGVQRLHAGGGYADEDGYPSLRAYADSVLSKMDSATASNLQAGGLKVNVTESLPDDRTRIAAELKAADPSRYYGTQFQRQAENFFSLLGGVV